MTCILPYSQNLLYIGTYLKMSCILFIAFIQDSFRTIFLTIWYEYQILENYTIQYESICDGLTAQDLPDVINADQNLLTETIPSSQTTNLTRLMNHRQRAKHPKMTQMKTGPTDQFYTDQPSPRYRPRLLQYRDHHQVITDDQPAPHEKETPYK